VECDCETPKPPAVVSQSTLSYNHGIVSGGSYQVESTTFVFGPDGKLVSTTTNTANNK
jgi:hypothetical protein